MIEPNLRYATSRGQLEGRWPVSMPPTTPRDPEEPLLTPKDLAHRLNVSVRTIIRMCASGQIPAIKVGRQWRIYR